MKLRRLRLRNFRCFNQEMSIEFDNLTVIIGKNDSGKSAILEAIEIFLNENDPDKDDASKGGDANDLTIICEFDSLPGELIIDEASPTRLAGEYLLNQEGRLEIHKTYSGQLQKPKCTSVVAFAKHPSAPGARDLLQLKNADLKTRAANLGVKLDGVNQGVNAQLRQRIREHIGNLNLASQKVPLNEANGKRIWDELKKYLPLYSLFKSDRPGSDQDPEAQDPLKTAVREALKSKEAELAQIFAHVRSEVQKIADSTLKKLREMDSNLASELKPTFSDPKWDSLFKASITSDDDIPINKRGSGVKRLVLLNFFRAKSEQLALEAEKHDIIYAIEEPETSQHPNNQRMLLRALSELSAEAQVIISTHTPVLARAVPDSALRYIEITGQGKRNIVNGGRAANGRFIRALGILPDHTIKLFIGVEGPNDISFLQNISTVLHAEDNSIPDLTKLELDGEILFVPLGGSTLVLWSSRLAALNRPEFHLCDRDTEPPAPAKYSDHVAVVNARPNCRALSTGRKEMENYLHRNAIIEAYEEVGIQLNIGANFARFADVPLEIAKLVHRASNSPLVWDALTETKQEEKASKAKRFLCARAVQHMKLAWLDEVDADGDVRCWFTNINELLAR
jgi:putative ATP-dependent endonuclease of the OLD family